jgi:hypothetical protein
MTVLSRGARARRGGRRPGWLLLTVLLVLAIAASSALVFTNRVELLKLAVILALWAAVVAAFVSVIYRRQSDADQAKVRDLKMVYDLQLDREISARREYELTVETHLRRELSSELRAQASDEVAALRAELAALRSNLEILFDADLAHRPAIETDRAYQARPDRVTSSRITSVREERDEPNPRAAESPILDVPEEPLAPPAPQSAEDRYRGSHRRPSEETTLIPPVRPGPPPSTPKSPPSPASPPPPKASPMFTPQPRPEPAPQAGRAQQPKPPPPQQPPAQQRPAARQEPPPPEKAAADETAPERSAPGPQLPPPPPPSSAQAAEAERRGRHSGNAETDVPPDRRGRHAVPGQPQPEQRSPWQQTPQGPPPPSAPADADEPAADEPETPASARSRHRGADSDDAGPPTGGQSVAELMARLQAGATSGGGRRRRRED